MLNKNIAKNLFFVTAFCGFCLFLTNCGLVFSNGSRSSANQNEYDFSANYEKPKVLGKIKSNEIDESSGIVASRCNRNVFWTHNDSGDKAFIFAIDQTGDKLATFQVKDAKNIDWEDIATLKTTGGECFLYLGDIGNNNLGKNELTIYKVKEPPVSGETNSSRENPLETESAEAIRFSYPDPPHNAETLLVHPTTGDIYILSKEPSKPSGIYKLAVKNISDGVNKLEKIGEYTVPAVPYGLLTGGEISPDGQHVVLCDYQAGYEIALPAGDKNFDDIWKQRPAKIELGKREQGEAICYGLDGNSIYATSEKKNSPLIEVKRK